MHNLLTRANAIFAFTLTVLASATFAAFCTTVFNDFSTGVELTAHNVHVRSIGNHVAGGVRQDLANFNYGISVDLTPIFNWNVKMVFLYLTAEYSTPTNAVNEVVIWDKIIMRDDPQVVDVRDLNPKYYFWDDGSGLKGNSNMTLRMHWNIVPNAGYLHMTAARGDLLVPFPDHYSAGRA